MSYSIQQLDISNCFSHVRLCDVWKNISLLAILFLVNCTMNNSDKSNFNTMVNLKQLHAYVKTLLQRERELGISWEILCSLSSIVTSLIHLLVQRPSHSPTYLCIHRYLGGWVGPSCKENLCPTILVHSHISLSPQSTKVTTSIINQLGFYPLYAYVKLLC